METEHLTFVKAAGVATVTLNRPAKLNAITPEMAEALSEAAVQSNADAEIRAVILTGAGTKAFCAGSDIKELDRYASPWEFRNRQEYGDVVRGIRKPVICAVNGYCLGGGLELAMVCDIRLASENAVFGAPEIKLGWIGGGGMAFALAHAAGASNAAMMLLTGEPIPARQAAAWGLVSEVMPAERLMERAQELASLIAQRPPIAAETAKTNLRAAFSMGRDDATRYERDLQTICFATEDAAEGREAFKAKRPPIFKGR